MAHAVRQRRRPGRVSPRLLTLGGSGVLTLLVAGVLGWNSWQSQRTEQVALHHYLNGVWATEVERWDRAVEEFAAAGSFRDAPQRRAQAEANLNQVQERYHEALGEWEAGRPWDTAYLLRQVLVVLPDYQEARRYLEEARRAIGSLMLVRRTPGLAEEDAATVVLATADLGEEQRLAEGLTQASNASFSPDGSWLTYEAVDGGLSTLWLVEVATGTQQPLVEQVLDFRTHWSSDGSRLLVGWQGAQGWHLSLRTLADGSERILSRGADFVVGEFSPRTHWVTVWERRGNQWSLLLGNSQDKEPLTTVVPQADSIGLLEWAGDEAQLAYGFFHNGQWRFYVAPPGTADATEVAPGAEYAWVSFRRGHEGFALWRWQAQIGTLALVTGDAERELLRGAADAWVRWSPDGRWLVVAEWNGRTWQVALWPISITGEPGERILLAEGVDDADALFADGQPHLLYRVWQEGRWSLMVRDLPSGESHTLLAETLDAHGRWTPDGNHVLLWWLDPPTEGEAPPSGRFAVGDARTGRRLLLAPTTTSVQGGFARDGSKMAFATQGASESRAWVANPDGTGLLELDRQSYRIYWATAPFEFGPRLQ